MRYKLQRNANGMITQCENADGGNIYAQRKELNKKALENLQRPTPGKLGKLSNLQVFTFEISNITTGTGFATSLEYNTTNDFPANVTQAVMFGVNGLDNKALYYNIVGINAKLGGDFSFGSADSGTVNPSYISFYLLQNIETSTTSLGTKIPQPAPLFGSGGGAVDFTTNGNNFGNQHVTVDLNGSDGFYAQNNDTQGLRASGLALRQINLNFTSQITFNNVKIDLEVYVDTASVSSTY
jgi:hypothetical protein